jgi:hypothetical protein
VGRPAIGVPRVVDRDPAHRDAVKLGDRDEDLTSRLPVEPLARPGLEDRLEHDRDVARPQRADSEA